MTAAILSAGPSLLRTWCPNPRADLETFAVNRAIMATGCDWFIAGDRPTFEIVGPNRPRLGTYYGASPRDATGWGELIYANELPGIRELPRPWNWSVQVALAAVAHRGHRLVYLYGVDHRGNTDASGTDCDSRTAERWEREHRDWALSVEWAERQGITIKNIQEPS